MEQCAGVRLPRTHRRKPDKEAHTAAQVSVSYPRPMNGIFVAITVMNCTFTSSGRPINYWDMFPGTPGHTILREVRIVGDHNSYHVGEFGVLRHVMGTWPPDRRE